MTALYFAYGSNLDLEGKLIRWAPSARLVGLGEVRNRRLAFTRRSTRWGARAADILPARGCSTWGALFAVHEEELPGLDLCEGAPHNYRRISIEVRSGGRLRPAISYEVVDRHLPEDAPSEEYLATMVRGAEAVGLPAGWVEGLRQGTSASTGCP